ncbi:hypothetical protein GA0115236_12581, partial [Streptomyces sp. IgraMP-1]
MYIVEPTVKTSEGMAVVPPSWPSGTRPSARPPPTQPSTVRAAGSAFEERSPTGERQSGPPTPPPSKVSPQTSSIEPSGQRTGIPRSVQGAPKRPVWAGPVRSRTLAPVARAPGARAVALAPGAAA